MPDSPPASHEPLHAERQWSPAKPVRGRRAKGQPRTLAIDCGPTWARGVVCERSGGRITVTRVVDERFAIDAERPRLRELLGADGLPAVVAMSRDSVLLGRLELPAEDEAELRSMARIALVRDFSVEGVETLSDFQRSAQSDGLTSVVVASASRARIDEATSRATAPVARVSARTLGMLALVRASDTLAGGTTLVLDLADGALECSVMRDGELLHSRGSTVPAVTDEQRAASALIEFRRFLASLRGSADGLRIDRVLVAAERSIAGTLVPQLGALAGCSAMRLDAHPRIAFASPDVRERVCASCLPLAGLLLEDEFAADPGGNAVDLLHPTPQIDVAARNRERILMVAGAVVIALLAGWTLGTQSWRSLEERHDDLLAKARNAEPVRLRYKRDELRARHIDAYRALGPDWLAHFEALRRFAPDPTSVVLDSLTVQVDDADIEYTDTGKMSGRPELRFVLDGEAKDRTTADALRDLLVKEKGYTVASTGADARGGRRLPYPFAYTLRTTNLAPKDDAAARPAGQPPSEAKP